jgi:CarboxypepD_reg-like domain
MDVFVTNFVLPSCVALFVALFGAGNLSTLRKVLLGLIVFVIAFLVSLFLTHPWKGTVAQHWVVAGTVEDETTREGVGQAEVSVDGVAAPYMTEDNGNFRIELNATARDSQRVRIKVSKAGYKNYEATVTPPKDNLTVLLRK